MSKYIDVSNLDIPSDENDYDELVAFADKVAEMITDAPSIDIVFCKECKHRPIKEDADGADFGFNIIATEISSPCPCLVDDGWYSWMPKDNFFCGYGEREGE